VAADVDQVVGLQASQVGGVARPAPRPLGRTAGGLAGVLGRRRRPLAGPAGLLLDGRLGGAGRLDQGAGVHHGRQLHAPLHLALGAPVEDEADQASGRRPATGALGRLGRHVPGRLPAPGARRGRTGADGRTKERELDRFTHDPSVVPAGPPPG
jgi:hypothetical protein